MKVLWFSNSPAAAFSESIKGTGGWMVALDKAIQDKVELHIAFHYPYKQACFSNGYSWYYPIYSGNIVLTRIQRRLFPWVHRDFTEEYLKIIRQVSPDIIHIHGSENDYHCIVGKTDVPIVISIQGNPTVYSEKYFSGFHGKYLYTKSESLSFKSFVLGRFSFAEGLRNLLWQSGLERKNLPYVKNIIGRTDWDRRITRVLSPDSRYFVVNEVLRESFYNHQWHMASPNKKLIIHTTNDNNYYKGFETLCRALVFLNSIGLNVEWRVAGIAKDSPINIITKKYLGSSYPCRGLVLLGSLGEGELIESMLSSHLYVMPSHIENSPNSLCEAMLLGMPCITTLAGGSDSILLNKKEGLVIQDGDSLSMAGAVLELKNNWDLAVMYGEQARKHALQRHDKDKIVTSLITAYRTIVEGSN
jgi:glycosyltransferase involved in cell wall biosynthesis